MDSQVSSDPPCQPVARRPPKAGRCSRAILSPSLCRKLSPSISAFLSHEPDACWIGPSQLGRERQGRLSLPDDSGSSPPGQPSWRHPPRQPRCHPPRQSRELSGRRFHVVRRHGGVGRRKLRPTCHHPVPGVAPSCLPRLASCSLVGFRTLLPLVPCSLLAPRTNSPTSVSLDHIWHTGTATPLCRWQHHHKHLQHLQHLQRQRSVYLNALCVAAVLFLPNSATPTVTPPLHPSLPPPHPLTPSSSPSHASSLPLVPSSPTSTPPPSCLPGPLRLCPPSSFP